MKRFKLLTALLIASGLTLSGCNLFGPTGGGGKKKSSSGDSTTGTSDSGSSGTSDSGSSSASSTSEEPEVPYLTAWPSEVVSELNTYVGEQLPVAPFLKESFYHTYYSDDGCYVLGDDNEEDIMTAYRPKLVTAGYEQTTDSYGYTCFVKERSDEIIVSIYANWFEEDTDDDGNVIPAGNEMQIYFAEKQHRTEDTDWPADMKDAMMEYVGEVIPFIALGENYTMYGGQVLFFNIYDGYTEDLTAEYKPILTAAGFTFVERTSEDKDVYTKTKEDGSVLRIEVYFDEYGNEIDVTLEPVKHTTGWEGITPIDELEAYSGKSIPQFAITAETQYTWYTFNNYLHVEGANTTNVTTAYETALGTAHYFASNGQAIDWYEKITIAYQAEGDIDDETGEITTVKGFSIDVTKLTPTSLFSDTWPTIPVNEYLSGFGITCSVPELTNETDYQVKRYIVNYDDIYEDYLYELEMWNAIIIAFGGEGLTEEEMIAEAKAYAAANAGLYISMVDAGSTLVDAYRALFGEGWTEEVQTDSESSMSYYYETNTATGVVVCVYGGGGYFYAQIVRSVVSTTTTPTTVSTTIGDYASAHGWASGTKYDSWKLDDVVTVTCSGGSNSGKYYDTATPNEWRIYHSDNGSFTISVAEGYELESITIEFKSNNAGTLIGPDGNEVTSGTAVEVSGTSATFTADGGNNDAGTNGQARVTSISVKYIAA